MTPTQLARLFPPLRLGLSATTGGDPRRLIAVAALRLDESSEISAQAGHAPNFLLFDGAGHLEQIVPNPYMTLHEDTAHKVAELLDQHHVRMLIACDFGERMAAELDERGIQHIRDAGIANIAAQTQAQNL